MLGDNDKPNTPGSQEHKPMDTTESKASGSNIHKPSEHIDSDMKSEQSAVAIKLNPFYATNPSIWFDTVELQFNLSSANFSDKTKFLYVLTALSPDISDKIADVIKHPPQTDMYQTIKRALLNRLTPSNDAKLELLLSGLELGDNRPSDLLRRMTTLAQGNFSSYILRSMWVRKLPEVLRVALVAQPDSTPIGEIAETADRIFEAMNRSSKIAAMDGPSTSQYNPISKFRQMVKSNSRTGMNNSLPTLQSVVTKLNAIDSRLKKLETQPGGGKSRSRSTSRTWQNRQRNRSSSGNRASNNPNYNDAWCVMHNRYKSNAYSCKPPCTFLKEHVKSVDSAQSKND